MRKNMRILVADDDPGIQDIFAIILTKEGYNVEVLPEGTKIMDDQYNLPDLFILDKQMPGMDGLDICRYLKKQQKTKTIPVIMVSASPDISTLSAEAGADDYMEKPFEMSSLLEKVKHFCR